MQSPIVIIGVGEMGGVFSRGLLRLGVPLYPVTRNTDMGELAAALPSPEVVVVAVGEADLQPLLGQLPSAWKDRLCLLQNELLPADWTGIEHPTVISVWFEKKKGMDTKVIIPSPVYGPRAGLIADALGALDIPTRILQNDAELLFELVLKNLYILTSNIAGLRTGGAVGELWQEHQGFCRQLANEVIDLQEALSDTQFDREALIQSMKRAFDGDPEHKCMGRSAPARLTRALEHGQRLGLELPLMHEIQAEQTHD
jgi:ketopantoate reductase